MTEKQLKQYYLYIHKALINRHLKPAFDKLKILAKACGDYALIQEINRQNDRYINFLKNSLESSNHVVNISYTEIQQSAYCILQKLYFKISTDKIFFNNANEISNILNNESTQINNIKNNWNDLKIDREINQALGNNKQSDTKELEIIESLFKLLSINHNFDNNIADLCDFFLKDINLKWQYKTLIISSLYLSSLHYFDKKKIHFLLNQTKHDNKEIAQRSVIVLILLLLNYQEHYFFNDDFSKIIDLLPTETYKNNIEIILLQYLKSQESERLSTQVKNELLPEMMKIQSKIIDKLSLDNNQTANPFQDENPEWETFFEDTPGLMDKVQEISEMQMDGNDMFLTSFAMLKHFPFFDSTANWFLPFTQNHPEIINELPENNKKTITELIASIEKTPFICNSDKYSFCLNLSKIPSSQLNMLSGAYKNELSSMQEIENDQKLTDEFTIQKRIITQYVQDIYRFFKLSKNKNNYTDIFNIIPNITTHEIFKHYLSNKQLRNIGEYYFQNHHYQKALPIFLHINLDNQNYELLEKTAFCYQKLLDYDNALKYYLLAELFDKNSLWLFKKIAYCYRKQLNYSKALFYLNEALSIKPNDTSILYIIGLNYLDENNFSDALKYFYKIENLAPQNIDDVYRPIGWCLFNIGDLEKSIVYFSKIIDLNNANKNDYMNLAHVSWTLNKIHQAKDFYIKALNKSNNDIKWFNKVLNDDSKLLKKFGISDFDITIMRDISKYEIDNE